MAVVLPAAHFPHNGAAAPPLPLPISLSANRPKTPCTPLPPSGSHTCAFPPFSVPVLYFSQTAFIHMRKIGGIRTEWLE